MSVQQILNEKTDCFMVKKNLQDLPVGLKGLTSRNRSRSKSGMYIQREFKDSGFYFSGVCPLDSFFYSHSDSTGVARLLRFLTRGNRKNTPRKHIGTPNAIQLFHLEVFAGLQNKTCELVILDIFHKSLMSSRDTFGC